MLKRYLFLLCIMLISLTGFAQQLPERSTTLVTDYTNTLSADEKQRLEDKLVAFNDSSSTQIAVVLMRSVGDYDIADYAVKLGRAWGIGQKDKNNGVLLLAALSDRKVTIQTGYGAEGAITDALTQQIIQNDLKPNFRQENYFAGLDAATDHLVQAIKGEYKAEPKAKKRRQGDGGGNAGIIIFIVIIILFFIFRNRGGGGGNQVIGRRGGASPFWWFLAGNMLGGGGRSSGGWGGFSGGGSSGGGGGFGGFGGGSFGGGGSSGSW
ncbi:TPM domain-containing protein [Mucilaginibacter sp. PAMB04274]|uniref:TPM domain-containing protein n=1 Tax=Mucilaginibacter sp. PAMB04274 TaxID=3138568 RepID=UPI0031F62F1F